MAKFQVRARTVDMLGRQQIAGIPTAISELFKNAHDAYARNVEVDYYREDGLFVLRDDGLGMTREDFEQRWLTLGTESKVGSSGLGLPPVDPRQPERPILGEKGIGRLAIAIIGPQVLVLSRARINDKPHEKTVAAFLHWGLFELPGLNLDDISIPVREFPGGDLPSGSEISEMVAEAIHTLESVASSSNSRRIQTIHSEMESFNVDPLAYSDFLKDPSLAGAGCGTHFYIIPTDPIVSDDIDVRQSGNKATRFEKNLIGFTNTMTPNYERPPIIARFRDHKHEGSPTELIGEHAFFTPEEFKEVDHHFLGMFDEYGQFRGQVGIYQTEPEDYVLNWSESDGRPTDCGPFKLSFAYMQGTARDSLVPPKEHARLRKKLDRHGGLYIYRDGIRVQPYGDSDYDWLDIERNRTLGAAYYFYSYRRMFGVIELSQHSNSNLTEKAGREGFRENRAYRQLRSILMNFFLQTAGDFFREEGKYADVHVEKKDELNELEKARRKKAGQVRKRRAELQESLEKAFKLIDERQPEIESRNSLAAVQRDVESILSRDVPVRHKELDLMRREKLARQKLHELRSDLSVAKPRGVGLSRELSNQWKSYLTQMQRLDLEVFKPVETEIERCISKAAEESKLDLDGARRLNAAVSESGDHAEKTMRQLQTTITSLNGKIQSFIGEETRSSFRAVSHAVDEVKAELDRIQRETKGIENLSELRSTLVDRIDSVFETERHKLERLRDQLNQFALLWDEDGYDTSQIVEALEEELEELKAQRDSDLELAQVGMALNTISHEFEKTVGSLREGLRQLNAWSNANPDLAGLYHEIRTSFDHLDEYLSLFTPLDRRLHRTKIDITGKQVRDFLSKLFEGRLERHQILLTATSEFLKASVSCYPSSLFPPFVNLVDNAIFWLQQIYDRQRTIELDAEGRDLLIRDNGPGVSSRDRENIFAMNFSRKPGGRGMGLFISRETLFRVGLQLTLDPPDSSQGAVFRISEIKSEDDDTEPAN